MHLDICKILLRYAVQCNNICKYAQWCGQRRDMVCCTVEYKITMQHITISLLITLV